MRLFLDFAGQLGGFFFYFEDVADHVEGSLGQMVQFSVQDLVKTLDGVLEWDQFSGGSGEGFGDLERLWEETLDFPGSLYSQFLLLRQFSHTQDSDDILEWFEILQDFLDPPGAVVVFKTYNVGVHDTRWWLQWVDGRVESQLSYLTRQYGGGVQVREGGGWGRIC